MKLFITEVIYLVHVFNKDADDPDQGRSGRILMNDRRR